MSLYFETSPKHCASKNSHCSHRRLGRRLLYSLSSCLLSLALAAFLVYLILHPSKPRFYLREAEVYQISLAPPLPVLNSTLQFTLVSTNPNTRVGVYYDRLRAYAAYRGQRITTFADIPPFYQGHQDTNLLSASLYGNDVPVPASLGYDLVRDQTARRMAIELRIDGRLRWKVATWVSRQYHVDVDCTAVMGFGAGGAVRSMEGTQCSTTV